MNLFELIIVQPIFNVLALIYGLVPGGDFGIAVILFTILIRLAMWPLVKKQLHQTKVMRKMQPELKKIKLKSKGNKQLETQMMMELYREKGINPFGSIGLLLLQIPIYIALYMVIDLITRNRDNIARFTYDIFEQIPRIHDIVINPASFDEALFGVVDLSKHAIDNNVIYWPILSLAVAAAIFQYFQTKQLAPEVSENRRLRDILKEQAAGQQVDQSEISAIVTNRSLLLFPIITLVVALYLPGALVLYFVVSSAVAIVQQHRVLSRDEEELEALADKAITTKQRVRNATEAEIIVEPKKKKAGQGKRKKRR